MAMRATPLRVAVSRMVADRADQHSSLFLPPPPPRSKIARVARAPEAPGLPSAASRKVRLACGAGTRARVPRCHCSLRASLSPRLELSTTPSTVVYKLPWNISTSPSTLFLSSSTCSPRLHLLPHHIAPLFVMDHSPSSSPLLNTDPLRPLSLPVPPNPVFNLTSMFNLEAAPVQPETTSTAACHPPTAPAAILAERSSALWHELDLLDIIPTPSSPSPQVHAAPLSTITSSANVASCALHLDHTKFPFDYPFSHLPPINFSISTPSSQISSMLSPQTQSASSTVSNMSPAVSDLPCDPLPSGCLSSSFPFSPAGATPLPPPLRKRPPAAAKAASLSSKTRIQKQIRRYTAPKSSLYCHLCARHRRSVSMVPCGNLRHGLCQKSVCSKCIATYVLDAHLPHWLCPHCLNNCPKRAKCFSYDRQTARRREKRLRAKLNCIKPADVQNENRTHCETLVTNSKTKSISSSKSGCL